MSDDAGYEALNYEITERGVLAIELDRPQHLNALSLRLLDELDDLVSDLDAHEERIGCVTVEGTGDAFSAGGEIDEFLETDRFEVSRVSAGIEALANAPVPVVAKIDGPCLGGGFELALACDLRVATSDSTFGFPEITLGLIPGGGGTQRLPEIVGPTRAKDLIYRGTRIDADQAERWGLVNRAVDATEFEATVEEYVTDLVEGPSLALEAAKTLVDDIQEMGLEAGLGAERRSFAVLLDTEDAAEGIEAFQANREAEFQGR
jgi:enoyl-CoA hydratase/3-hydroxyacyl-CoA dehydrogenase